MYLDPQTSRNLVDAFPQHLSWSRTLHRERDSNLQLEGPWGCSLTNDISP